MRKFIKYFVCGVLIVLYSLFLTAGFLFNEIKQAFVAGTEVSEALTKPFGDWLHND